MRKKWSANWGLIVALGGVLASAAPAQERTKEEAFEKFAERQAERLRNNKPPLTIIDLIDMYSLEDKKAIIRQTVERGGMFLPIRGRWGLIADASTALPWAYHEQEPFDERVLDVLGRVFKEAHDPEVRFRLAALLYRYRSNLGEDHLVEQLQQAETERAALILAMNREPRALTGLKRMYAVKAPSSAVIEALGGWAPETSILLGTCLREGRGSTVDLLRALTYPGHRGDRDTLAQIERMFLRSDGVTKVAAAGALARLRSDAGHRPIAYLIKKMEKDERSDSMRFFVVRALSHVSSPEAVRPLFRKLVQGFTRRDDVVGVAPAEVEAALHLARNGVGDDHVLVVQMLGKMKREGVVSERDIHALAVALLECDLNDTKRTVRAVVGPIVEKFRDATRKLKKLPPGLLPLASRSSVGPSYMDSLRADVDQVNVIWNGNGSSRRNATAPRDKIGGTHVPPRKSPTGTDRLPDRPSDADRNGGTPHSNTQTPNQPAPRGSS